MAEEIDKATEARRKALRNGEEDPVIVAQRFLNIYRQRHIFSAERKEAFDKMLLELSPDIRGLFSALPGGIMLQDYVDELAEKNGMAKSVRRELPDSGLNEDAKQQAQILATALAQSQSQAAAAAQPAAPSTVTGTVSMGKDFAGELAKVMNGLIAQQTSIQQQSLEKLAQDLSKTQMFIAKMMKEGKEEQVNEIKTLCETIADGQSEAKDETTPELGELCKTLIENQQADKEELRQEMSELCKTIIETQQAGEEAQRQEIGELCKVIAESQTALSASLSNIGKEVSGNVPIGDNVASIIDDGSTKKMMELIVEGQKQLHQRLDKVEEISVARTNDNQQLIEVFEKSQEKLINTLLTANVQQNNIGQSTNNANNIQITTPDNSAQMLLLVDKIASLQASNEQSLENAITRAIEEQGRLYDKISRQQTKELAEILAESLKDISRPVVYAMPVTGSVAAQPIEKAVVVETEEPGHIPPQMDEPEGNDIIEENIPEKIEQPEENISEPEFEINFEPEPEPEEETELNSVKPADDEGEPKKKKKRKRKKKKKNSSTEDAVLPQEEIQAETIAVETIADLPDFSETFVEETADAIETDLAPQPTEIEPSFEENAETLNDASLDEEASEEVFAEPDDLAASWGAGDKASDENDTLLTETVSLPLADSSDDWGFASAPSTETEPEINNENSKPSESNDNNADDDWEWEYVEDVSEDDYQEVEVIGGNSYIYSSDLYSQEKTDAGTNILYGSSPINMSVQPVIVDNAKDKEFIDPYQNSILKD